MFPVFTEFYVTRFFVQFFSAFRCPVVEAHTLLMKLHSFSFPFMVVMGRDCRVHK